MGGPLWGRTPIRVYELLVGLPDVSVLGVDDEADAPLRVHVQTCAVWPPCRDCDGVVWCKDLDEVELVDLPCFGRPIRLVLHKRRWACPAMSCPVRSFTVQTPEIAPVRGVMTDRAGRWACEQVGRLGRTVAEVARELGCDWHTVNDAVVAYGTALVDGDTDRIGEVTALLLDFIVENDVQVICGIGIRCPGDDELLAVIRRRRAGRCLRRCRGASVAAGASVASVVVASSPPQAAATIVNASNSHSRFLSLIRKPTSHGGWATERSVETSLSSRPLRARAYPTTSGEVNCRQQSVVSRWRFGDLSILQATRPRFGYELAPQLLIADRRSAPAALALCSS